MRTDFSKYLQFLDTAKHSYSPLQGTHQVNNIKKNNYGDTFFQNPIRPTVFILDLLERKYLAMSPSVQSISGYSSKYFMDGGVDMAMTRYHPIDAQIYFGNIFFKNLEFFKKLPASTHPNYCFGYNYRFLNRTGEYRTILQKLNIIQSAPDGTPLLILINATDITHFKNDHKIIHTIERMDVPELVYKKVYFLKEDDTTLSARETEILKWVSEGLSSKQIADKLFLSIHTVHNHRKNILDKTQCTNTADLIRYAVQQGLL